MSVTPGYVDNLRTQLKIAGERIRELEIESEARHQSCLVLMKSVQDHRERICQLEVALRSVRTILQSDSIEYDDMRHINDIIDAALACSPSRPLRCEPGR